MVFEIVLLGLTFSSFFWSVAGSPVVSSTGLTLPTPILGAAPAVSPIGAPLASVPALAGLGGSGLQIPTATLSTVDTIGVPSECLSLKDMFDPKVEVGGACLF